VSVGSSRLDSFGLTDGFGGISSRCAPSDIREESGIWFLTDPAPLNGVGCFCVHISEVEVRSDDPCTIPGTVATGSARGEARGGISHLGSVLSIPARSPSPLEPARDEEFVSLRTMKAIAEGLEPTHPFRILLFGEPDQIFREEYATKVVGWHRLILNQAGSVRLDDR
jgi:hypothetical protein